ncbi:MAG TPA: tetratricopeptide repeat protein, partial [Polyangiaceae bacterium]
ATAKGGTLALGTHAFAVKAGAALLVGGLAAGGYVALKGEGTPAAPGVVPAARTATSTAPPLPRVEMAPAPISPPPAPSEMPAQRARESDRRASLAAESALLTEARAKLRSGDANGAAETLERLRARFPRGVLGQEREVLAIEILMAQGSRDAAKTRARAFIRSYPRSPHVEKLGRLVDEP